MNPDQTQEILSRLSHLESQVSALMRQPSSESLLISSARKRANNVSDAQLIAVLQSTVLWLISKDQWVAANMIEKEIEGCHG